jgi:hypothetical protein
MADGQKNIVLHFFFKLFISNQNYIRFYKLICCDSVWREENMTTMHKVLKNDFGLPCPVQYQNCIQAPH